MRKIVNPICTRCAQRLAVACVLHAIGHKDAVCCGCVADSDVMLPLYWPAFDTVAELKAAIAREPLSSPARRHLVAALKLLLEAE